MQKSLFLLALCLAFTCAQVALRDVQVLVLQHDLWTTGRRSPSVPQINVVSGSAKSAAHSLQTLACHNIGFDGSDVVWRCEANLKPELKLGRVTVTCEGYGYPNDPLVLAGSCGAEVELNYAVDSGESLLAGVIILGLMLIMALSILRSCYYYDCYILPYMPIWTGWYHPYPTYYYGYSSPSLFPYFPPGASCRSFAGSSLSSSFATTRRR